jgi:hypothetical protein
MIAVWPPSVFGNRPPQLAVSVRASAADLVMTIGLRSNGVELTTNVNNV